MSATTEEIKSTHWFTIQNREVDEDTWEDWSSDTDPAELLREFVNAVSSEEIDDVNRYWRVVESDEV